MVAVGAVAMPRFITNAPVAVSLAEGLTRQAKYRIEEAAPPILAPAPAISLLFKLTVAAPPMIAPPVGVGRKVIWFAVAPPMTAPPVASVLMLRIAAPPINVPPN